MKILNLFRELILSLILVWFFSFIFIIDIIFNRWEKETKATLTYKLIDGELVRIDEWM